MEKYLKAVYFTVGLAVMIFVGSINALLMTPKSQWFASLDGMMVRGKIHSVCWLVIYLLMSVHIGEIIGEKKLRSCGFIVAAIILLSTAWCGVFFRLHSMTGAVVILAVDTAFVAVLFVLTMKKTRLLALFTAPVLSWYTYLLFVNGYLALLN